jgi:hypothetical protein
MTLEFEQLPATTPTPDQNDGKKKPKAYPKDFVALYKSFDSIEGIEAVVARAGELHDLPSKLALVWLMKIDESGLKQFLKLINCFEPLDNRVADFFIVNHWYEELIGFQSRFEPFGVELIKAVMADCKCDDEQLDMLLPKMSTVSVAEMLNLMMVMGRTRAIDQYRDSLTSKINDRELLSVALANDNFEAYEFYAGQHYKSSEVRKQLDDHTILSEMIDHHAAKSFGRYMKMIHAGIVSKVEAPALVKRIMIYAKEIDEDGMFRSMVESPLSYFKTAEVVDYNKFIKLLIEIKAPNMIPVILRFGRNLNRETAKYLLETGAVRAFVDCSGNFDSNIWDREMLDTFMALRAAGEIPPEKKLPYGLVYCFRYCEPEVLERIIDLGWGGQLLAESPELKKFVLEPRHLDRILDYIHNIEYRPTGEKKNARDVMYINSYYRGIANYLSVLPFALNEKQADDLWDHEQYDALLIDVDLPPGYFNEERIDKMLETESGVGIFLRYLNVIIENKITRVDAARFYQILERGSIKQIWHERHKFEGLKYDQKLATCLLAANMDLELVVSIDQFGSLDDRIYRRLFDDIDNKPMVLIELQINMINRRLGARAREIFRQLKPGLRTDEPINGRVSYFEPTDETALRVEQCEESVLIKLLKMDSFPAVFDWLAVIDHPEKHVEVLAAVNERLRDYVKNSQWLMAGVLLEAMSSYNIPVNQDGLMADIEVVRKLSVEGQFVANDTEDKMLKCLVGHNTQNQNIVARLRAMNPKDVRLEELLRQTADREAMKQLDRMEKREVQPIYEGPAQRIIDIIGKFYVGEYFRVTVAQIEQSMAAAGQELSSTWKIKVGEVTNHDQMALWMRDYLMEIIDDELQHGATNGINRIKCKPEYDYQMKNFLQQATTEEVICYLDRAEATYRDKAEWNGQGDMMGGKAWAEVAYWTRYLVVAMQNQSETDLCHALDTIISLQHNTDSVFNKSIHRLIHGTFRELKPLLDWKFNASNLMKDVWNGIMSRVSDEARKEIETMIESLRGLPGYDFDQHEIMADVDWRHLRGVRPQGD